MSLVCAQCSRVNPEDASYCYFDGAALAGRAGGPINAGAAPFPNPFVFPNGHQCRNFDQLALACQQNWSAAIDLLRQGFLGSFFGGIGRVDLAAAAQEAAKFPDLERGLDQLIAKLPTQAVQPPKLQAEPSTINLGVVKIGQDRSTELHLSNVGMRLLYGTVTSDCKWLTLGDAPGHPEKLFQFGAESIIPVQIRGQHLRAGTKPLEGRLTLDSNGGTVTVTVRADVPITPYEGGVFAGSTTPRQIAEKSKANVKEAAPLFESGAIAKWYHVNGWVYPVQGPTMPGPGGIQQFFEALGVAKAPKVEFTPTSLSLEGAVGKTIETAIEVTSAERKVIYGWATCDASWVEIGKTKLTGKVARIPILIHVPSPCPPTLETTLHVVGNGNQKKDIPITVKVAGGKSGVKLKQEEEFVALEIVEDEAPLSVSVVEEEAPAPVSSTSRSAPPPPPPPPPSSSAPLPVEVVDDDSPFAVTDGPPPVRSSPVSASATGIGKGATGGMPIILQIALNLIPVAILAFCLLILIVMDFMAGAPKARVITGDGNVSINDDDVEKKPVIKLVFDEGAKSKDSDTNDTMNWAVHAVDPSDPNGPPIRLNFYKNGAGNNIIVKVDNRDFVFGEPNNLNDWLRAGKEDHRIGGIEVGRPGLNGKKRTFEDFKTKIRITQTVTIEPTEPVEVKKGEYKRFLATALARYKIENKDSVPHTVGLRILMDTFINESDDVPFIIPGIDTPVTTKEHLIGPKVPAFVQVIEKEDVRKPGIVLHMGLQISDKIEPPDEFVLTKYPGRVSGKKWKVEYKDFTEPGGKGFGDSSVLLYWNPKSIPAKQSREIGFTYGLGSVAADSDKLGMTVGGGFHVGGDLTVVALVSDEKSKSVTLKLPAGMSVLGNTPLTQPVPPLVRGRASPVTWRVQTNNAGAKQEISITTDTGLRQLRLVTISQKSLFN